MVVASVKKKQVGKWLFALLLLVVAVVVGIFLFSDAGEESGVCIDGSSEETRRAYLLTLGLQVADTCAVADVCVPEEFDERFAQYNEMLCATGFDLTPLKGAAVQKYTYTVTNRSDICADVKAILLVYEGNVVGGHLLNALDNTLYPLFETEAAAEAQETILPAEMAETEAVTPQEIPAGASPID